MTRRQHGWGPQSGAMVGAVLRAVLCAVLGGVLLASCQGGLMSPALTPQVGGGEAQGAAQVAARGSAQGPVQSAVHGAAPNASQPSGSGRTPGTSAIDRQVLAPGDGWGSVEGGTRGGADAPAERVYDVRTRQQLVAALAERREQPAQPRIVRVHGTIDLSQADDGRPLGEADFRDPEFSWQAFAQAFAPATWGRANPQGPLEEARRRSARRQAERTVIRVPSHTTLIGVGVDARLLHGSLFLDGVTNVIVRNLHLSSAFDHFPAWDPRDGAQGAWNAEYDLITLREATHVWVDHCTFDNGPPRQEPVVLGQALVRYDGLLDITRRSNWVTVSWNRFSGSEKGNLVGSGDGQTADDGRLKVSFHHNMWTDVMERAPRVRYGQVHIYNNLFVATTPERYGYSLGVGRRSRILSQANAWELPQQVPAQRIARWWGGEVLMDQGSIVNGLPVDLLAQLRLAHPGQPLSADIGWWPPYSAVLDRPQDLAQRVRAQAGHQTAARVPP
jgi:pectate lyase